MLKEMFKPGDIIRLKDKEYIVIQDYGFNGLVKENYENGAIINGFSWVQNQDKCEYIKREEKEKDIIDAVKKEYEDFFEKYEV